MCVERVSLLVSGRVSGEGSVFSLSDHVLGCAQCVYLCTVQEGRVRASAWCTSGRVSVQRACICVLVCAQACVQYVNVWAWVCVFVCAPGGCVWVLPRTAVVGGALLVDM